MKSEQALENQSLQTASHPVVPSYDDELPEDDGSVPEGVHLAPESIWPVTLAFGVTLGFMGFVTTAVVSIFGGLVAVAALVNWVQELRHERH